MISQTVEYALRAVVALAASGGIARTAQQLAVETHVPVAYLLKVLQVLVRSRLVRSQRGLHGGFFLTRDPAQLTIWDVVDAVEPIPRYQHCPLGLSSHAPNLCPLHRRLDEAMAAVEAAFRRGSIAELLRQPGATPLCEDRAPYPVSLVVPSFTEKRA